jgi:hypothetical protein
MLKDKSESTFVKLTGKTGEVIRQITLVKFLEERTAYFVLSDLILQEEKLLALQIDNITTLVMDKKQILNDEVSQLSLNKNQIELDLNSVEQIIKKSAIDLPRIDKEQWSDEEFAHFRQRAEADTPKEKSSVDVITDRLSYLQANLIELKLSGKKVLANNASYNSDLALLKQGVRTKCLEDLQTKNLKQIETSFLVRQLSIESKLESLMSDLNKKTILLAKFSDERNESRRFENQLKKSSIAENLFSRVNPYNWGTRDSAYVTLDINRVDKSIQQIRIDIIDKDNELRELIAKHAQELIETKDKSRAEVIAKLTENISATTLELSSYNQDIVVAQDRIQKEQFNYDNSLARYEEILSDKSKLLLAKHAIDFKDNHQRLTEQKSQIEKTFDTVNQSIKNLKNELDVINEQLETGAAELTAEINTKISSLRGELEIIKLRLEKRADRIGISIVKSLSDPNWVPIIQNASYSTHQDYITERLAQPINNPSYSHATLPISIQNRIKPSGKNFLSKKDKLLNALTKINFIDSPVINELEELKKIDSFSELVFGGDGERRKFYVTCLDNLDDVSRVLLRPMTTGPRMIKFFSENLVPCLSCSIEFSKGVNSLQYWDVVLVPNSAPRPFERILELERRMGFESDIPVTHSIKELLSKAGYDFPAIRDQFRSRADDWVAYISWGKNQLYKQAPIVYLGNGELNGTNWIGVGIWTDRNSYNTFIKKSAGDGDKFPLSYEIGLLNNQSSNVSVNLKIGNEVKEHNLPTGLNIKTPIFMEIEVSIRDRERKTFEFGDEDIRVVYNLSSLIGSLTQIKRQSDSLEKVFGAQDKTLKPHIYRQFGTQLGDSPYLSATFFNVTQAAIPTNLIKVPDGAWRNPNLNLDQKLAIQKMLSVPDIAYIQGPPGTGKTSMIAEACSHFIRMGKRVLIASQTNLAVDNALERLKDDPEIRPIRIRGQDNDDDLIDTLENWYKSAAVHTTKRVLNPLTSLRLQISKTQRWLSTASSHLSIQRQTVKEVSEILLSKLQAQTELEEAKLISQKINECNADSKWWGHIIAVLDGTDWDPAIGKNVTQQSVFRLFEYAADFHLPNLTVPKVGTSSEALQRHAQRLIGHIKAESSIDSINVSKVTYENFVSKILIESNCGQQTNEAIQYELHAIRVTEFKLKEISQYFDDADSRLREVNEKINSALNESPVIVQSNENLEVYLSDAIEKVEKHLNLLKQQQSDYEVFSPWISLLQDWSDSITNASERTLKKDEVWEHYNSSVNVAGITCNLSNKTYENANLGRFDVVIIDEVSKATPLELLMPLQKSPCAILVGDHRQLPPTFEFNSTDTKASVNSPTPDENDDMLVDEADLLERYKQLVTASLFKDGFEEIHESSKESLLTQYRMHPAIMSLVNRFYDNRLKCGLPLPVENEEIPKWAQREHGLTITSPLGVTYLKPDNHVLWLDSTKDSQGKDVYEHKSAQGVHNKLEVQLVTTVTKKILEALTAAPEGKTISIITFYNEQKRLLKKEVADAIGIPQNMLHKKNIEIETVDRFQGKETDIVIVSMVRNPSFRLSQKSNPAKFERINVAFSRARDLLVIVGSDTTFGNFKVDIEPLDGGSSRKVNVYGQIIEQIRENGGFWRASDVLGSVAQGDIQK